jgi:hypothetical protein
MILDIRFTDKGPSQYQGVRMFTVYPQFDYAQPLGEPVKPEVILHFADYTRERVYIPLANVVSITTTND